MSKKNKKKANKAMITGLANMQSGVDESSVEDSTLKMTSGNINQRGYQIITMSRLMSMIGENKSGEMEAVPTDMPLFFLTPEERFRIMQTATPILGIISGRMNRISGMNWVVSSDKKEEDKIAYSIRSMYQLFKEYANEPGLEYIIARARIATAIKKRLPDVTPSLSNFSQSLLRWKKSIEFSNSDRVDEIQRWLNNPNPQISWQDFIKEWVQDYLLHGAAAIYKDCLNGRIENLFLLPGGSVIPYRSEFVSHSSIYIQVGYGKKSLIYRPDELAYNTYLPTSMRSYGIVPIEALINKVTETLLFDRLMAEQADGSQFPQKMIIVMDNAPFGDNDMKLTGPAGYEGVKRLEEKLKQKIEGGMVTLNGTNAEVVDLSRENTMGLQSQRQKDIREDVGLAFNVSNMEINLTGGDEMQGRTTSEVQQEIEQGKGIVPIISAIENMFNSDIFPYRYGGGYNIKFEISKTEREELELTQLKMATGVYSVNEIRVEDLGKTPFDDPSFDKPAGLGQQQPDGSQTNPLNMRQM